MSITPETAVRHTPEPWTTAHPHLDLTGHVWRDGRLVAGCCGHQDNTDAGVEIENNANADRIVACVNALDGMNPEGVVGMVEALKFSLAPDARFRMDKAEYLANIISEIQDDARAALKKAGVE